MYSPCWILWQLLDLCILPDATPTTLPCDIAAKGQIILCECFLSFRSPPESSFRPCPRDIAEIITDHGPSSFVALQYHTPHGWTRTMGQAKAKTLLDTLLELVELHARTKCLGAFCASGMALRAVISAPSRRGSSSRMVLRAAGPCRSRILFLDPGQHTPSANGPVSFLAKAKCLRGELARGQRGDRERVVSLQKLRSFIF